MPFNQIFTRQILTILAGMLLAIALLIWWYTKPDSRLTKAANQVVEIANAVHKHYIGKAGYWGLDNQTVAAGKILDRRFYRKEQLVNALGKPVLIGGDADGTTVMPGERSFNIVYANLSMHECIALATYNHEQSKTLSLLQITIGEGQTAQSFGWGEEHQLPISRAMAKKFCHNNTKVVWTME